MQEPLAPAPGLVGFAEQAGDIGFLKPEVAQGLDVEIMSQRPRQDHAIDAAGRCTGNNVDDDAQIQFLADEPEHIEIDRLGVGFTLRCLAAGKDAVGVVVGQPRPHARVRHGVISARRAGELQNFLGDAMHVDGQRNAAIAYQRETKFLFLHVRLPVSWTCACIMDACTGQASTKRHRRDGIMSGAGRFRDARIRTRRAGSVPAAFALSTATDRMR